MADPDVEKANQSTKEAAAELAKWNASRSDIGNNAVGTISIIIISIFLLTLSVAIVVSLVQLWPLSSGPTIVPGTHYVVLWIHVNVKLESSYFLIVVLAGALGGALHSLRSIAFFVGERKLLWSWILYYACLPIVASLMSVIFYLVLRGGLISSQATSKDLSPYGIASIAGLVGLFSDEAATMLKKIFSNLFTSSKTDTPNSAPLN